MMAWEEERVLTIGYMGTWEEHQIIVRNFQLTPLEATFAT